MGRNQVKLAKHMQSFIDDLMDGSQDIDTDVCADVLGYIPEDMALRMAEAATAVLVASKSGQDSYVENKSDD